MSTRVAVVTGAAGLLGNNLVRALRTRGWQVRAWARSAQKAEQQLGDTGAEVVLGDLNDLTPLTPSLAGADVVFHTAAYFRDNYKGGRHWAELEKVNIEGTRRLLDRAYSAGIRRFVHTSSVAVLGGSHQGLTNVTMRRRIEEADDYQRSKILSEEVVREFLRSHPDFWAVFVLPGWMHGPGDLGPTSAGQFVLDYMHRRLPGVLKTTFSVVDARDVAETIIAAESLGVSGESYLATGRTYSLGELSDKLQEITGVPHPKRLVPMPAVFLIATFNEFYARLTRRPVLLSLASARLIARSANRTEYDRQDTEAKLGIRCRPVEETLRDELAWFRAQQLI
jgi:nucleoside-diphosphate-sugar epimerase